MWKRIWKYNKKKIIGVTIIFIVLLIIIFGLLVDIADYRMITYKGNKYELVSNDIRVDFSEYDDFIVEIGYYKGINIYEIKGINNEDFLLLNNPKKLKSNPDVLYKNVNLNIDNVKDFNANSFNIYFYDEDIKRTELIYNTEDLMIVNEVVNLIDDDNIDSMPDITTAKIYSIEFTSSTYPNLVYGYNYVVDKDNNCFLQDTSNVYKISGYINTLLYVPIVE